MADEPCSCCGDADENSSDRERADDRSEPRDVDSDRVLTDSAALHATLPGDVRTSLGSFLGTESVGTLAEWVATVRQHTGGDIDADDLCHASGETPHWGRVNDETYHFQCFYDAVALSAFVDDPVEIRTESPAGTVVRATADGARELSVTPENAVFSFGVAADVDPPADSTPSPDDVYAAVCPYVRAFPDADAYEQWAASVPAATVAMPLAGATELAAALVA